MRWRRLLRPPHSLPRQRVARACEKNRLSVDTLLLWSALSAGRRPKYKKKSGEPDEFDEEQADVVAVANVILAMVPVGFGPAVYDFLRARTTTTASTVNLHALEETVATTSQPAQATRCKGLREEQTHPRRQLVIVVTFTLHKTN